METTTEDLWCSGCQCNHPVSAFGVDRSRKSGYRSMCRESRAKADAKYQKTEKGRAAAAKRSAEYYAENREAIRKKHAEYQKTRGGCASLTKRMAKYQATINERAWAIIGKTCAWSDLGGCCDLLCKDHIVPVIRRRSYGYASHGGSLNQWIVANPAEAKKRLQCLCEVHNYFKNDMPEDEARAKWIAKHPRVIAA